MSPVAFVVLNIEGTNELTRNIDKLINGSLNEEPCTVSRRKKKTVASVKARSFEVQLVYEESIDCK